MWKELLLVVIVAAVGFNIGTYIFTGTWPILTWATTIQQLPATLTNVWNQAQTSGISPLQAIGAIGSVGTAATVAIAKLKQRMTAQAEQAKAELDATKNAALESQSQLKTDYQTLESKFNTEAQKVEDLKTQLSNTVSKQEYERMQLQYTNDLENLRRVTNIDYVRKLQAALQANGIPLPPYEGKTITVVK